MRTAVVAGLALCLGVAGTLAGGVGGAAVPAAVAATVDETWYVTFHGGADAAATGHGQSGINQVEAYDSSGSLVQPSVLEAAPTEPLSELRGMALGSDGTLYLANATRTDSAVLHFGAAATQASSREVVSPDGVFASGAPENPGLDHPYGLAFTPAGELLASSQDTQTVTRFTASGEADPSGSAASWWVANHPDLPFTPGTLAPPVSLVHAKDGGLTAPRGIVVVPGSSADDDATLYVADNGADAVRSYDAVTGEFLGDVLTAEKGGLGSPVGLAVSSGRLFVTSEGTDDVVSLDLATGKTHQVAPTKLDHVTLDHPSGIAFGSDGRLYVASRVAQQIVAYTLDSKGDRAVSAEVFVDHLPDQPEQLLALALPVGEEASAPSPEPAVTPPAEEGAPASGTRSPADAAASAELAATGSEPNPMLALAATSALVGALLLGAGATRSRRRSARGGG